MTTTAGTSRVAAIAPPKIAPPRRRSRAAMGLGVALIVVCSLGGWYLFRQVTAQLPYLAVARQVAVGAQLSDADLTVVHLNKPTGLAPIPAAKKADVVGKQAAVALVPGTLLTAAELTDEVVPGPGKQVVGINLKPSQQTARVPVPGDKVLLVETEDPAAAVTNPGKSNQLSGAVAAIRGVVHQVGAPSVSGDRVIDVVVNAGDGPKLATLVAAGRVVVVLTAAGS